MAQTGLNLSTSLFVHLGVLGLAMNFWGFRDIPEPEVPVSSRWLIELYREGNSKLANQSPRYKVRQSHENKPGDDKLGARTAHPAIRRAPRRALRGSTRAKSAQEVNSYLSKLHQRVQEELSYPLSLQHRRIQGTVQLRLKIGASGKLASSWVEHSSGSELLDRLAMDAVARAQPFQPIPKQLAQKPLEIQIPVEFRLF